MTKLMFVHFAAVVGQCNTHLCQHYITQLLLIL